MRVAICGPVSTAEFAGHLSAPVGSPAGLGGAAVNRLVCELLRRGHGVTVVSSDPSVGSGQEVVLEGERLRICYGPYRPRKRARDGFRTEREFLARALAREQPDIVHAHWTYEFALGALDSGVRTLVTCRDWAPAILRYKPDAYRAVRLGMQFATFAKGRHFTAVSPYIRRRIAPLVRGDVAIVPNGIEDSAFRSTVQEAGRSPLTFMSINLGFGRRKNVTTLLAAFGRVRVRWPDVRLVLVGSGYELGGPAQAWALARGLHRGVEFRGPVPQRVVGEVLRHADVLVHPSREESFGNVLVEAMARRIPVVGGRRSGAVPWVLDQGRAGVLTDVTASEQLAAAMEALLDRTTWLQYARAGQARAWGAFRMQRVADLYEECYQRVLECRGPR